MAQTHIKYEAKESEQKPVTNLNCSVLADALVELTKILKFLYLLKAFVNKKNSIPWTFKAKFYTKIFINLNDSTTNTKIKLDDEIDCYKWFLCLHLCLYAHPVINFD